MEYEKLEGKIKNVIMECNDIVDFFNIRLKTNNKLQFQKLKEIEKTISRMQKKGMDVPEELMELKLKLLAKSNQAEDFVKLKKYFIQNIQNALAGDIKSDKGKPCKKNTNFPPENTLCHFKYKGSYYKGKITKGLLDIEGYGVFSSFSSASKAISKTSRNGWQDWMLKIPGSKEWILADSWRNNG